MTSAPATIDVLRIAEKVLGNDSRGAIGLSVHEIQALALAVLEGNNYLAFLEEAAEAHNTCSALIATTMLTLKSVEGEPSDALVVASQGLEELTAVFGRFRNYKGLQ